MLTQDTPGHPGTHLFAVPSQTSDLPSTGGVVVVSTSPKIFIELIVRLSPLPTKEPPVIVVPVMGPVEISLGAVIVLVAVIFPPFPNFNMDVDTLGVLLVG